MVSLRRTPQSENTVKATGSSARLLITYSEFYCSIVTKKAGIITQYRLLYEKWYFRKSAIEPAVPAKHKTK